MATSKTISVSPGWSGGNTWVDLHAQVHSVTRDAAGNITIPGKVSESYLEQRLFTLPGTEGAGNHGRD